jgi:hypothetical protein
MTRFSISTGFSICPVPLRHGEEENPFSWLHTLLRSFSFCIFFGTFGRPFSLTKNGPISSEIGPFF